MPIGGGDARQKDSDTSSSLTAVPDANSKSSKGKATLRTVVTSPPWARDEPPSPVDAATDRPSVETACYFDGAPPPKPPAVVVTPSSPVNEDSQQSNWWMMLDPRSLKLHDFPFNNRRPQDKEKEKERDTEKGERFHLGRPLRERSRTWLSRATDTREANKAEMAENLRLELPLPPPQAPFTVSHTQTPGWNLPWSPSAPRERIPSDRLDDGLGLGLQNSRFSYSQEDRDSGSMTKTSRRKRLRRFILGNTYVPLLFRVLNLTFTSASLAIAIRIRRIEMDYHVEGVIGSSPYLVIIFAPLTLVHVMFAIYLEYFGRPLGLWKTSAKLAHTLSEVFFICAWSAALSLCFDNIFTSPLECTPASAITWYSTLPPPVNPLTGDVGRSTSENQPTDRICDDQAIQIGLVFVGLCLYCSNLVISLYRIFEKVKYHTYSLREA
ncbi:hypothetical protein SISNIDRAFT_483300 [Sistotremastrum niveocremeum HHB9708]|uniref:Uncharacterized protein n=2 Tax=Sistotremastraceae TaxID=3402574 RepID=A0A164XDX1_9AGAM|nr:hypothetical protein SISNIDRAFT_483300 [Sistotremastrum niveocremeum HHB9708]KZT41400.1 hypothetical protein SISSUDRAFT_306477 [Sistotremastrum suecicum HHB10207 ss-3]